MDGTRRKAQDLAQQLKHGLLLEDQDAYQQCRPRRQHCRKQSRSVQTTADRRSFRRSVVLPAPSVNPG